MIKHLITIFLCLPLIINAQKMEEVAPIDISDILSYEDFQKIKQFILKKGKTKTYGNKYGNNPYYQLSGNIELFLNPTTQFPKKNEVKDPDTYDTILFRRILNDYPLSIYTEIVEDASTTKVYLHPHPGDTKESMRIKEKEIRKYITAILKKVR